MRLRGEREIISSYPSYLKLHQRWLHSLTRITYLSKRIGIRSFAALMQLQLSWVWVSGIVTTMPLFNDFFVDGHHVSNSPFSAINRSVQSDLQ
ncbi:hypothetical protein CD201_13685 [Hafnia alvei]|nr:hypothetical protein CD201_13685 [Hafnia alvei]